VTELRVSGSSAPLLARVLRGEIRLPFAFWVLGVAANLLFVTLITIASDPNPDDPTVQAADLVYLIYFIFSLVVTWRSASRYAGDPIWADLTKVIVGLVSVTFVIMLFFAWAMAGSSGH
jgi:hypothetical protein